MKCACSNAPMAIGCFFRAPTAQPVARANWRGMLLAAKPRFTVSPWHACQPCQNLPMKCLSCWPSWNCRKAFTSTPPWWVLSQTSFELASAFAPCLMSAQAVPSIAPSNAAAYFHKTECFCFTQQVLQPGQRIEMPVRFIVDRDMPKDVKHLTLSYTLFDITARHPPVAVNTGG